MASYCIANIQGTNNHKTILSLNTALREQSKAVGDAGSKLGELDLIIRIYNYVNMGRADIFFHL